MNKNRKITGLFHKGAYLEALQRLLIPAVAVFALLTLVEAEYMSLLSQNNDILYTYYFREYSFSQVATPMWIVFLVASPLFMLYLFGFQLKRSGSDAVHALPISKEGMAFSYLLSVLTMDILMLLAEGLLIEIMSVVFPYMIMGTHNNFLVTVGIFFAASLLTAGLMLLALSLGGSFLSVSSMYLMLLFIPRLILTELEENMFRQVRTISDGFRGTIFDIRLNAVSDLVVGFPIRGTYEAVNYPPSFVYTLILGCAVSVAGIYFMRRRPSETAEQPAVSDRVQAVFRTLLGCCICLAPLQQIVFPLLSDNCIYWEYEWKSILMSFLLAVAIYMLYELILTRSGAKCIKALPGILYLVVFCLLYLAVVFQGAALVKKALPKEENIRAAYMQIYGRGFYCSMDITEYFGEETKNYRITDREALAFFAEKIGREEEGELSDGSIVQVNLKLDGGTFFTERTVHLNQEEILTLMGILAKDTVFTDIFLKPIPQEEIEFIHCYGLGGVQRNEENSEEFARAYAMYCGIVEEMQEKDFPEMITEMLWYEPHGAQWLVEPILRDGRHQTFHLSSRPGD